MAVVISIHTITIVDEFVDEYSGICVHDVRFREHAEDETQWLLQHL